LDLWDSPIVKFEANDSRDLILSYYTEFTGNNVTVGVRDNGIFNNHPSFNGIFHQDSEFGEALLHGTHVTGIIAGQEDFIISPWGNSTIKGVSYDAEILFRESDFSLLPGNYYFDFLSFKNNNAQISNHSYGWLTIGNSPIYSYDSKTTDYDDYADTDDLVLIAAAGNEASSTTIRNPALGKNVIAVGAIDYTSEYFYLPNTSNIGLRANYSSQGPTLDDGRLKPEIVAPGGANQSQEELNGVVSASAPDWELQDENGNAVYSGSIDLDWTPPEWSTDDNYIHLSGTSMAAPHVTGICAKLKEANPGISSELMKALLINTTIPLKENSNDPLYAYANTQVGYGMVNGLLITDDIPDDAVKIQQYEASVDEDNLFHEETFDVYSPTQNFAITMVYDDVAGEQSDALALKDNLDLVLIAPSGVYYRASDYVLVPSESPIEKMIIDGSRIEFGTWTSRIEFVDSPDFPDSDPLMLNFAYQDFAVVVHAFLKTPDINIIVPQSTIEVSPSQIFSITPTFINSGGYIVAGTTIYPKENGTSLNTTNFGGDLFKHRYIGNLVGEGDAITPQINLVAPEETGVYEIEIVVDAINKVFDSDEYPISETVTVVVSNELVVSHSLNQSTFQPQETGIYTVAIIDENGSPGSGYHVEYVVELEPGNIILNEVCPETASPGVYQDATFQAPGESNIYSIYCKVYLEEVLIKESSIINFNVEEMGLPGLNLTANPNPCPKYATTELAATLLDASGNPIVNEPIEFVAFMDGLVDDGDISPHIDRTNNSGIAYVNFTPEGESGNIKAFSVNNPDIEALVNLQVSTGNLTLEVQIEATEIGEFQSEYELDIRAYGADGNLAYDAIINEITTTLGTVQNQDPTTGGFGIGHADIVTTQSGEARITVNVEGSIAIINTYLQVGLPDLLVPVIEIIPDNFERIHSINWSDDGSMIMISMRDFSPENGRIDIFDTNNWQLINTIYSNNGETFGADFSPDGNMIVAAHQYAFTSYNWDGSIIATTEDPDGDQESQFMKWASSNKIYTTAQKNDYDNHVTLRLNGSSLSQSGLIHENTHPDKIEINTIINKIAIALNDKVNIYNSNSFSLQLSLTNDQHDIKAPTFSFNANGDKIVITRDNDYIRIFNSTNGNTITDFTGTWDRDFSNVDWSPNDELIAAYNEDRSIYIFDYSSENNSAFELYKSAPLGGDNDGDISWNPTSNLLAVENEQKVMIFSPTDIISPTLSVTYPADTLITFGNSIVITGFATDQNGIKKLKILTPLGNFEINEIITGSFSQDIPLQFGENALQFIVYDNNWNSARTERMVILHEDTRGPTIGSSAVPEEIEINQSGIFAVQIIDDISGVDSENTGIRLHNEDSTWARFLNIYDDGSNGDLTAGDNIFSCTINPQTLGITNLDQTYYIDIEAYDNSSNNNSNFSDNASSFFLFDRPLLGQIETEPEFPNEIQWVTFKSEITDYSELTNVTLFYRHTDSLNFIPRVTNNIAETDTFATTISPIVPGQYIAIMKAYDTFGKEGISDTLILYVDYHVGVEEHSDLLPLRYNLYQNFPNPFNPITSIRFDLPISGHTTIDIYNVLGQKVKTLINSHIEIGRHKITWNGQNQYGTSLGSGIYIYRIQAGRYSQTRKMILLK
jgi:hypothetical protein